MKMSLFLACAFGFSFAQAADTLQVIDVNAPAAQSSTTSQEDLTLEGTPRRLGTTFYQRPQEGGFAVKATPSLRSTMANPDQKIEGTNGGIDVTRETLDFQASAGITPSLVLGTRFSTGTDTVRAGDQTLKRRGLSDFFFSATENRSADNYDWFVGAELGISPGRSALPQTDGDGANRYSGGPQVTPFIGMQAESEYDFDFGGRTYFTYRAARFMTDGSSQTGGHILGAEAFAERDYNTATLGLNAALIQRLGNPRDQIATLNAETALGLGAYAEFEVIESLFIPVHVNSSFGLSNRMDGETYSQINNFELGAGAAYYF